jgi:small neutral amino acid transporter SnatA (MarC family)
VAFYFLMVLALFAIMGGNFRIAAGSSVLAVAMGVIFIRALARPE